MRVFIVGDFIGSKLQCLKYIWSLFPDMGLLDIIEEFDRESSEFIFSDEPEDDRIYF